MSMQKWHVQINGGEEQTFETQTGLYHLAASAALAVLDFEPQTVEGEYNIVKIWVPNLLPEYAPSSYAFDHAYHLVGNVSLCERFIYTS